ncbi:MAG: ROK family transcriptional regulator, partial [Clostridiaceae bacterium]|nr:ROK family transcriptional regulator [Clostridiaceae bacterium]
MNMILQGTNNLEVKSINKKRIIGLLYQQKEMTKQDLARSLGLSIPTVSQILKELTERGLVKEAGMLESTGGRKPTLNALVYDAKFAVGIEITLNHIRFVLIDLYGNISAHKYIRICFQNTQTYTDSLNSLTEQFIADNCTDRGKILGIGIAIPGIVQKNKEMIEYVPTLRVKNYPLSEITKNFRYKVKVDNEANLAGFAEIWCRQHISDAVFLSINKGVGGAVIINDKVYYGSNYRAGEFGHMTIVKDGKKCACGKKGCFEAYCSTMVLSDNNGDEITDFFKKLEKGNKDCMAIWDEYLDHLAAGINNIRMVFDSEIIIGGDIHRYIKKYINQLN